MSKTILLLLLLVCQLATAQNKPCFDNLTTEDGLSDNYTTSVYQDKYGWIWIGTGMGVERYDGIRMKKYGITINDSVERSDLLIRDFYESKDGTLYLCIEENGLVKYNRQKDQFERLALNGKNILTDVSVKCVAEDADNNLWAATKNGICKIDFQHQTVTWFINNPNDDNSLTNNYVRKIVFDNDYNLWIATQRGLDKFIPAQGTFVHYANINPLLSDEILDICIDHKQRIWVGASSNGLVVIDKTHITSFAALKPYERSNKVNTVFQDRDKKLWFGTRGGLFSYDEATDHLQFFENSPIDHQSLVHNSVMDIAQDAKGDLWIATRGGISYMVKEKQVFESYFARPNNNRYLNNSEVYCIWMDKADNIWLGTENGGINILNRQAGTFNYLTESNSGLSNNCIKCINSAGDGKILIGTFQGGLNSYDERTGRISTFKHDASRKGTISSNVVWDICVDKTGGIWIGTSAGLDKYDPQSQTFEHYPEFDDMVNGATWIDVDNDNDLWLGSQYTVVYRPGKGVISQFKESGRSFFVDNKGNNWLMTSDRGIVLVDKHKGATAVYDEKSGIASKLTYCMLQDANGKLWVSTANGLSCFDSDKKTFKNFYKNDGLQGNQFHYGAAFQSRHGHLLFGGVNGLNIFNPERIVDNQFAPPVYITDFKIFNQSVKAGDNSLLDESVTVAKQIEIPYKYNVLTFEFAALNYTNSSQNKYKYQLEGFNKGWIEASDNKSATYTNLSPGKYQFRVMACNNNGLWNNAGASVQLIIVPPFYRQAWFLFLIAMAMLSLTWFVFSLMFKRRELRKAYEFEKVRAQKLHELDAFKLKLFTNISHEIKTPLTLIVSPLKKILKGDVNPPELTENLRLMEKNAEQLMALVSQLLDYRKLQDGQLPIELKRGDVVHFCKQVFLAFENVMRDKAIKWKFDSLPQAIVCYFDAEKLKTIINNLVSNAIKYNKTGGTIHFAIGLSGHNSNESGTFVKIEIEDSGIGIHESDIAKIFDRYYSNTNGELISSSGIGLAYVKELVDLLDGQITVASKIGQGTAFKLLLPFMDDAVSLEGDQPTDGVDTLAYIQSNAFQIDQKNRQILLVIDDNHDVLQFIKSHFKQSFIVLDAKNGREGLDLAFKTIPDIIISDVMMPDIDGKALCQTIKLDERTSHIPVVLLTALSSAESYKEGLTMGADDYMTKPFDIDILQTKVRSLLDMRHALRLKYAKELVAGHAKPALSNPDEKFLEKAVAITEKYIDDPDLDIDTFAKEMAVSRMQLYRKLAALTNMTVKEFVNDIRLKRAAQFLSQNKANISDVAYSVGFSDLSYFGKCFKKKFGMSPSEYNQKHT